MSPTSLTGSYAAYAGIIVTILHYVGVDLIQSDVEIVIGALLALGGVIYSNFAHKKAIGVIRGIN